MRRAWVGGLAMGLLLWAGEAHPQDASTPGTPSSPYPTFHNLSVVWPLSGDDDYDGVVTVRYRREGDTDWQQALNLLHVPASSNEGFSWENKHAGSVFGLEPNTTYEIELSLDDPDGGSVTEIVTATTRALPVADPNGTSKPVTPATIDAELGSAVPGDIFVLADGTYGDIFVTNDGTPSQPIVLRAETPGGAVIDGEVRMDGRADVHVEGLHVLGQIKFNDALRIVVRGCTIDTAADGIVSFASGTEGAYIVDNVINGPTAWNEAALGASGNNLGEGIVLTGPGNVIAFNRVAGFRDCVSLLEDGGANNQVSIDIYGNDLDRCADDAIEADFSMGNVRVYNNRILNSFMGLSSQPSLGGPTYFIRNVMFNIVYQAFKLQRSSVGDIGLHNTVVKSGDAFSVNTSDVWYLAVFRNNIFLGGPGADYNGFNSGPGRVMQLTTADGATCSFDYDGYGSIGTGTFQGNVSGISFSSLAEMQSLTTEVNAVELGLDTFAETITLPTDAAQELSSPPLALAEGSAAIDAGLVLPNINDGFGAAAPDLGAYELGQPLPIYGPGGTLGTGGGSAGAGGNGNGNGGEGGNDGTGGSNPGADGDGGGDDGGCGCRLGPRPAPRGAVATLLLLFGVVLRRRRATQR